MSALLELAERCERATGANKVLDEAIFEALAIVPSREHSFVYPYYAYTASLDAAMTLVPPAERWPWNVTMATFYCSASVIPNHGDSYGVSDPYAGHSQGKAATPILALCAAALRARAAA